MFTASAYFGEDQVCTQVDESSITILPVPWLHFFFLSGPCHPLLTADNIPVTSMV